MDQNLAETKQTTIETLYAIRAGVSYLGEIADLYKRAERVAAGCEEQIKKNLEGIKNKRSEIDANYALADAAEAKKADAVREREVLKGDYDLKRKKSAFSAVDVNVLYIISIVLAVGMTILCLAIGSSLGPAIVFYLFHAFTSYGFYGSLFHEIKEKKKSLEYLKKQINEKESEIRRFEAEAEQARGNAPRITREVESSVKRYDEDSAHQLEGIRVANEAMLRLRQIANTVYEALVKEYGGFCHPDDWKNGDRILYYLITGRADTLRDALNLMDRHIDAEMLANELRVSTEMISGEIRRSTRELTAAVSLGAERICDSMARAASAIAASNDRLAVQTAEANSIAAANLETNRRLVSAQELNNSLQRKANTSMEQLLRDYQVVNNRVYY